MNSCSQCGHVFEHFKIGQAEPDVMNLCLACGHIQIWTEELTLRELTEAERIEAGTHAELMRERHKIVPDHSVKHKGTSLLTTCLMALLIVMVVLEKSRVIPPIHSRSAAPAWTRSHPHPSWPSP